MVRATGTTESRSSYSSTRNSFLLAKISLTCYIYLVASPDKSSTYRWNICVSVAIVCITAVLTSFFASCSVSITISGLSLGLSYQQVLDLKGNPSFKTGSPLPTRIEYWHEHTPQGPPLYIVFDEQQKITEIGGGLPQLNGRDASSYTLKDIERELGPSLASSFGHQYESETTVNREYVYLKYPNHHLLVRRSEPFDLEFILFNSHQRF